MANTAPVLVFMPVGFRFRPTDEELVGHYLRNRLMGKNFVLQIIPEIDICKHEPWELPAFSIIKSDDPEWFFFSPRYYKYSKSARSNRSTLRGFWKVTGKDRDIKVHSTDEKIGTKKTLVFHVGHAPNGVKTNWVIHEYHALTFPADQRTFVLCKLIKRQGNANGRTDALACDEGEPSSYENPASEDRSTDVHSLPSNEAELSSLQVSPMVNEQELSFSFSPRLNSYIGNEDISNVNLPCESTDHEEEDIADKFVDSIFSADDEEEMRLSLN